jgi:hypothetical protein
MVEDGISKTFQKENEATGHIKEEFALLHTDLSDYTPSFK